MTRIDFYVWQNANAPTADTQDSGEASAVGASRDKLICRLTEKAYQLGHQIYILTTSATETRRLDDLLWVFNPNAFIPHAQYLNKLQPTPTPGSISVLIGQEEPPLDFHDVLLSLSPEVPASFSRFQRLIEFAGDTDAEKQQSRQRFRFYRDRGYALETHSL